MVDQMIKHSPYDMLTNDPLSEQLIIQFALFLDVVLVSL